MPLEHEIRRTVKRVIIYARVSSDKQEDDGTSLDTQVEDGEAYAKENGYEVIEIVREKYTGSLYRERKKLARIREMARNGEFEVLIIRTFDRLSRNQTHLAVLTEEMKHAKISLECVKEKFDDTPAGQFMRNALGFVAEVEREKIIDRTQTGRRKRVAEGRLLPGVKARYGYEWGGEHKDFLVVKDIEAETIREIYDYFISVRTSCNGVTRMLTEKDIPSPSGKRAWNRAVVYDILTDPIYTGKAYAFKYSGHHLRPREEWVELPDGIVPVIIDEETFNKAQELLKLNRIESMRHNPWEPVELLRCGFVRCGYCNRFMVVNRYQRSKKNGDDGSVIVYACRNFYKNGSKPRCGRSPSIVARRLDEATWEYVGELIKDFSLIEEAIQIAKNRTPTEVNLKSIERSIRSYQEQQDQYIEDLKTLKGRSRDLVIAEIGKIDEYLAELEEDKVQVINGELEMEKVKAEIDKFISWIINVKENYATANYEEKRRALRHLGVVAFVYRKDDVEHEQYEIKLTLPSIRDIVLSS